jgi:hypothetical protein
MTASPLSFRLGSLISMAVLVAGLSAFPSLALARGGSGRAYTRMWQQQMKYMQKASAEMQKQQKEQEEAFMKRFDTNKNGKIDGKEKGPAKKYLRQIELGIDPDKSMKSMGRTSTSFGPRTKPVATPSSAK